MTSGYVDLVDRLAVSVTTKLIARQFAHRYFCWQNHNGKIRMVPFEQHVARIRQAKENGHRIGSAWDHRFGCLVWYELHVPARIQRRRERRPSTLLTPKKRVRMVGQPFSVVMGGPDCTATDADTKAIGQDRANIQSAILARHDLKPLSEMRPLPVPESRCRKVGCYCWGNKCVICTSGKHYHKKSPKQPGEEIFEVIAPVAGAIQVVKPL